ncbi:MAG: TolC family protein [Treponema sp.]|nr:TolC family protein [Treponema sp.]
MASAQIHLKSAEDAVNIAKANDVEGRLNLKRAQEEVRLVKKSIGFFLPEFDFSLSDSAYANLTNGDYKQKTIEAGITQKIFNGGKSVIEWKMNEEKSLYNFWNAQKEDEEKKNTIVKAYYEALLCKLKSIVLEETVLNALETLKVCEIQNEEGMISKADYLESQIRFRKILAKEKNAQNETFAKCRTLRLLMNIDNNKEIVFEEAFIPETYEKNELKSQNLRESILEINEMAIKNSLDLKKALSQSSWISKQRTLLKRAFLPSVSVRAGLSFDGRNYPLSSPTYSFKVIMAFENTPWLSINAAKNMDCKNDGLHSILDSLSAKAKYDANYLGQLKLSKIDLEKSKVQAQKTKKEIESQVMQLIQAAENLEEESIINFESLKLKEKKLELSKIQHEDGRITKSAYLEDLNEFASEKINYFETRVKRKLLLMELETLSSIKF